MQGWNGLDFSLKEVNCFLRPQAVACEEIASGYGALFLFVTSLYRAWGLGGYFVEEGKQHFAFARSIFAKLSGIELDLTHVMDKVDVPTALKEKLSQGRAAIVPANLRELPYFQFHGKADQAHFFLVTGFEPSRRLFSVRDNLHRQPDHQSTVYENWTISEDVFERILRDYWDTCVQVPGETSHVEPFPWILEIRPGEGFRRRDEDEIFVLMLSEYERLVGEPGMPGSRTSVDSRHLDIIRTAAGRGEATSLDRLVRAYLADANFSRVHLKVVLAALTQLGGMEPTLLAEGLQTYEREAGTFKTKLFVKLMLGGLSLRDWRDAERQLTSWADEARRRALTEIGKVLGRSEAGRQGVAG